MMKKKVYGFIITFLVLSTFVLFYFSEEGVKKDMQKQCEKSDFINKSECMESRIFEKAILELEEEYCSLLEGTKKGDCNKQVIWKRSLRNRDPSIITDRSMQDNYYHTVAMREENSSFCSRIKDEKLSKLCYDQFSLGQAFASGNCTTLLTEWARHECVESTIMTKVLSADDPELCEKFLADEEEIVECRESYRKEKIFIGDQGR